MLEVVWFVGLMALSIVFAVISELKDGQGEDFSGPGFQIASHGAALMAIIISWERTGAVLLSRTMDNMPQAGTPIAELTSQVLAGGVGFMIVLGVPFITMMSVFMLRKKPANCEEIGAET